MLDLNEQQIKDLTIWAYDRLWDMMDNGTYDGDTWFTVDDSIPELSGKIDVNIYDDGEPKSSVKATCYAINILPDGFPQTNCDNWINLF